MPTDYRLKQLFFRVRVNNLITCKRPLFRVNLFLGEVELGFDCLGGLGGAGEGDFIDGHALVL